MMAMLSLISCNQNGSQPTDNAAQQNKEATSTAQPSNPFASFAEHFSQTASFAYANVGGHEVMLVSHETFGNNENDDVEAIAASIFALDDEGKIVTLGSVRSQGTLYPVSILDGKLMVAGHQFVRIYSVRGEFPELVLDSYKEDEGPELADMYKTFEQGTSVKFTKKTNNK